MLARISAEILQRWFDFGRELQPARRLALLCGHPRSGTTLLEQVLDSHPDIVSAEETEIFHEDAYVPLLRAHPARTPAGGPQFRYPSGGTVGAGSRVSGFVATVAEELFPIQWNGAWASPLAGGC